jgi:Mg2+/Co2+ transporter CorC
MVMNERILMLAKQSGLIQYESDGKIEEVEKFAELIVRECMEACSRANEIRHFVPPTQEQVVLSCMREIETTFRS